MNSSLLESFWVDSHQITSWTHAQWELLLAQARRTKLLGKLATSVQDQGLMPAVKFGPYLHLESGLRLAERQQREVRWEVNRIAHALHGIKCPVVLLKGAAYLMEDLPAARGRLFSDIDLLVPREHIVEVENALFSTGWICDERDSYNQRYYREWMHEIPPLRHVQRNTFIDLHHTITPPTSRFNVDGGMLFNKLQPVQGIEGLFVLAPVDMVLHSAVHLFQEGEFTHGLRDLLDLKDLLQHFSKQSGFWDDLFVRADELKLQIPLFHALFHVQRLFGFAASAQWAARIHSLGPSVISRVAMAWMLGLALKPDHPSCDCYWTGLARWLLYVRAHALRMPLRLVIPHLVRKAWMNRFSEK